MDFDVWFDLGRRPGLWAEISGHSIEMAMKYGRPKAREKERTADALDDMVSV